VLTDAQKGQMVWLFAIVVLLVGLIEGIPEDCGLGQDSHRI
jgi:hypothetical protein